MSGIMTPAWTILSAFAGAYVATRNIGKLTIGSVRYAVAGLMVLIGTALVAGVLG